MPRSGAGVYSKPVGTTAVTGTTIESSKYNDQMDDFSADLNLPRPVVVGGTGASNEPDARQNLGLEIGIDVLAYDAEIDSLKDITDVAKRQALGMAPPNIGDASVLDGSILPGTYRYDTGAGDSGGPAGIVNATMLHLRRYDTGGQVQVLWPDAVGMEGLTYTRSRAYGAWGTWLRSLNSADFVDEDDMASNSAIKAPSQQSVKSYVDSRTQRAVFHEGQASGVAGGTFTSGSWVSRALNQTNYSNITGASLTASEITLPAGVYRIEARAPAYSVDRHQARIRNVTSGIVYYGSNSRAAGGAMTDSHISVTASFAVATVLRLEHQCETTRLTDGFGLANSFGGGEKYAAICIDRIG